MQCNREDKGYLQWSYLSSVDFQKVQNSLKKLTTGEDETENIEDFIEEIEESHENHESSFSNYIFGNIWNYRFV